jgi:hypothetical protein
MKKTRIACAAVGVFLLAAALLLAFLITPKWIARLPSDTHKTRTYEGTFQSLLDPQALATGNVAGIFKTGVPLAITQEVKVEKTSGNTALVGDTRVTSAGGTPIEHTKWEYALDRRSLEAVKSRPSGWTVVDASGLTVSWPFDADTKTYQGWTPETQKTAPLTYLREESKQGLSTYVFQAKVPATKIVDSQILATLPKALPKDLLAAFAQSGAVPAAEAQALGKALPALADPVPLAYTFEDDSQFWIEPTTGVVIDLQRTQKRVAELELPGGTAVPLLPVAVVSYHEAPASVKNAAKDASDGRSTIRLFQLILPIILAVVGAVLLLLAVLLRGRRVQTPAPPVPPVTPTSPTPPVQD